MSKYRQAARVDENQAEIVKQLRAAGMSVEVGHDDILVGHNGRTFWFELKDPAKVLNNDGSMKAAAIKPSQKKLLKEWRGHYEIAYSFQQIMTVVTRGQYVPENN